MAGQDPNNGPIQNKIFHFLSGALFSLLLSIIYFYYSLLNYIRVSNGEIFLTIGGVILLVLLKYFGVIEKVRMLLSRLNIKRYIRALWVRKGSVFGYLVIFSIVTVVILELRGSIDLVPQGTKNESQFERLAPIIGAFGSVALSFGLLILYSRQTKVLEQQYQPFLAGEVDSLNPVASQFLLRNSGSDFAYDIEAEWTIGGEKRVWETPSLGPGETVGFPIVVDDEGGWLLNNQQVRDYLEERDVGSSIEYQIRCKDQFGIRREFSGEVNVEVITKREESHEIWDSDPLDSIDNSISNIEASIDAIASDIDDRRDEEEWKNRWDKNQAIISIVSERESVSVDVLARMIDSYVSSIEYRLSELEEAGYIVYDEDSGKVELPPDSGENRTLSEFQ